VFVIAQLGQGLVAAVVAGLAPVRGATGAETGPEGLPEGGVDDATMGAPHVSQ